MYRTRSEMLAGMGVNLNFGIVADMTTDPYSFIYPRVFRNHVPYKVAMATKFTTDTLSTLKHFPGHG